MRAPYLNDGDVRVYAGDCVEVMAEMDAESVDAIVCDPPYDLTAGKRGGTGLASVNLDSPYGRSRIGTGNGSGGFMGKEWDATGVAFDPATWREALRVLKPGGHLLAFGGTRTEHRLTCAIEDAGFEIRDKLVYMYGSGFPKSLNVSRAMGALLPDHEQCACAPHLIETPEGCGADCLGCCHCDGGQPRTEEAGGPTQSPSRAGVLERIRDGLPPGDMGASQASSALGEETSPLATGGLLVPSAPLKGCSQSSDSKTSGRASNTSPAVSTEKRRTAPRTLDTLRLADGSASTSWRGHSHIAQCNGCGGWRVAEGFGTALKPAWEPVVVARKPLVGTVAGNVLAHGTGALNIDGCRIETTDAFGGGAKGTSGFAAGYESGAGWVPGSDKGRWPANVALDSEAAALLDAQSGERPAPKTAPIRRLSAAGSRSNSMSGPESRPYGQEVHTYGDTGGASRFFYTAKASRADRGDGNTHPTVKPTDLMRWLVRLVTPPGGLVLDPFAGSGTTGVAARAEGFRAVLIEREDEYLSIISRRLSQLSLLGELA